MFSEPLVFSPYYRPQVWGGRGLSTRLGRTLPDSGPYGESWELSSQALHVSEVADGPGQGRRLNDIWKQSRADFAGPLVSPDFPLLVKWLECNELLSLQVHPDDSMARRVRNEPYGKSEAWVVIDAKPAAKVYAGLKPGITRLDVEHHLKAGTLVECLHSFTPRPGDCIALPAGSMHAAGGGILIAEIQQSSDATYRLFDWNRMGLDGKPRALQIELALEATNWNQGPIDPIIPRPLPLDDQGNRGESLVAWDAFCMDRFFVKQSMLSAFQGELTIWMVLEGTGAVLNHASGSKRTVSTGTTIVIPAAATGISWQSVKQDQPLTLLCARAKNY